MEKVLHNQQIPFSQQTGSVIIYFSNFSKKSS